MILTRIKNLHIFTELFLQVKIILILSLFWNLHMKLKNTKISLAVVAALSSFAYANESVKLDVVQVVSENAGAKSKTNVVTLKDLQKSTNEDLRGVLSAEPAINFGGGEWRYFTMGDYSWYGSRPN